MKKIVKTKKEKQEGMKIVKTMKTVQWIVRNEKKWEVTEECQSMKMM